MNMNFSKKNKGNTNRPAPTFHLPGGGNAIPDRSESLHEKVNRPSGGGGGGDAGRKNKWNGLLRISAFAISLLGIYISAQFSVDGFEFQVDDRVWIGWGIAAILVVIESVWQKFGNNTTLFVLAITCYIYGIFTNVAGIISNRGGFDFVNPNYWSLIVPIVFGILLEVFPEPILAWAISGDTSSDPLGKFLERLEADSKGKRTFSQMSDEIKMRIGK